MPIRQRCPPTDEFVKRFQDTIVPSAIPSSEFIYWDSISEEIENYENQIETAAELRGVNEKEFVEGLTDALMQADDTREWIDFYFELLGERGNKYSAVEGVWKFYDIQRAIDSGEQKEARSLANILQEIGLQHLVDTCGDIRDHFRGMLVGMESHARKNRQGECFESLVEERIKQATELLRENGYYVEMDNECITDYEDETGQSKTVDFAIFEDGELRLVVEANCYKTGGSKPSEVRRSYNHVARRMRNDGRAFVWVTDGQAWEKSLDNVLRQSYEDIVDLYNLHQADEELPEDVLNFFETGEV